jgi:hypothetical protein
MDDVRPKEGEMQKRLATRQTHPQGRCCTRDTYSGEQLLALNRRVTCNLKKVGELIGLGRRANDNKAPEPVSVAAQQSLAPPGQEASVAAMNSSQASVALILCDQDVQIVFWPIYIPAIALLVTRSDDKP